MRLLILFLTTVAVFSAEPLDRTVRYVNNDVITLGDVQLRNSIRVSDFARRSKPLPATPAERERFSRDSLDEVTDDMLLTQYAKTQGIIPDHDAIVLDVLNEAKRSGLGVTLREQAERRRHLERKRTIDILTWRYDGLAPQMRPAELQDSYNRNTAIFHRPNTVRLLQIMLRPTQQGELAQLNGERANLLRRAQDATDPRIKALVDARLNAYLAANDAGRDEALRGLVSDLSGLAADRSALPEIDQAVVAAATALHKRQAAALTREDVQRMLDTARLSLAGLTVPGMASKAEIAAFRSLAQRISQGATAINGGELGEIEPGQFAPEFDAQAFALAPGEISPVFWTKDTASIVLCVQRQEAVTRSFSEVSGEIERRFLDNRLAQTRQRLVEMLRRKASIRDLPGWSVQP